MRLARLGKIYRGTRQNPLFGPGLTLLPPKLYVDELSGDRRVIHIAKPHGSCNFAGWARSEVRDENGRRPLYPIEMLLLRDSALRILDNQEVYKAAHAAGLVLPGEWSCWDDPDKSTRVEWAAKHKEFFVEESRNAPKLLVAGFGYGAPDRAEFDALVGGIDHFEEIHVVHPDLSPSAELLATLEKRFSQKPKVCADPSHISSA